MAIAYVQKVVSGHTTSSSATLVLTLSGITTTVGNFLILRALGSNTGRTMAVTDSRGNTWTTDLTTAGTAPLIYIASAQITTALVNGDTITLTLTGGSSTMTAWVIETTPSTGFDVSQSAVITTATASDTGASAATAVADSIVVGYDAMASNLATGWASTGVGSWTDEGSEVSTGSIRAGYHSYKVVAATGAQQFTASWATAVSGNTALAVYKGSAAGIVPARRPLITALRIKGNRQPPWARVPIRVGIGPESPTFVPLTQANADVALIDFAASDATVSIAPVPAAAAVTFAAPAPAAGVGAVAGNAAVTFTANAATVKTGQAAFPGVGAITFAALAPAIKVSPAVGRALVDFRANQPTVSNLTVISLLIGGTDAAYDYIGFLRAGSLRIRATSDRRDSVMDATLVGSIADWTTAWVAGLGLLLESVVQFQYGTQVLFSGRLRSMKPVSTTPDKAGNLTIAIGCQDWTGLAVDTVVDPTIAAGARTTVESDKARIAWLFGTFYNDPSGTYSWGLDYLTNVATIVASMPAQDFSGMKLSEALDAICAITGGTWYVDFGTNVGSAGSGIGPDPSLHYYQPDPSVALTSPYGVAATDTFTATAHGMSAGQAIVFDAATGGTGLSLGVIYYVIASGLTANAFKISATLGGASINFTSDLSAGSFRKVIAAAFGLSDAPDNITTYGYSDLTLPRESTQLNDRVLVLGANGYAGVFPPGSLPAGARTAIVKDTTVTDATSGALAATAYLAAHGTLTTGSLTTRQTGLAPGTYVNVKNSDQIANFFDGNPATTSQVFKISTFESFFPVLGNISYKVTFGTIPQLLHNAIKDIAGNPTAIAQAVVAGVLKGYIGEIIGWPLATPPVGFLVCNGASLLRASYPDLFAVLGTTFGAADGTHFTLPNLTDRMILGVGAKALAATGGGLGHSHTGPSHSHSHSHAGLAHTHTGPSHQHSENAHQHELPFQIPTGGSTAIRGTRGLFGTGNAHAWGYEITGAVVSGANNAAEMSQSLAAPNADAAGTGATGSTGPTTDTDATAGGTGATGTADPPYLALYYVIRYA